MQRIRRYKKRWKAELLIANNQIKMLSSKLGNEKCKKKSEKKRK